MTGTTAIRHVWQIGMLMVGLCLLLQTGRAEETGSPAGADAGPVHNPAQPRGDVPANEQIQFDQSTAEAHMRELEGRMFRLAGLLREAQPEDADRLLLGLRRSKEQLIVDRMQQASTLLSGLKLEQAASEQREILARLEELKRLLLTSDISLQLKLQQLRSLIDARQRLDRLIRKEQTQRAQTGQLSPDSKPDEFANLESEERRNQRSGEDLAQSLRQFGQLAAGAAGAVGGACQCMGSAGDALGQSLPTMAGEEQQKALEQLRQAAAQLAEAERNLKAELEALVRQQVMENLVAMIAGQLEVREATVQLSPRAAQRQRQAVLAVRQLADEEEKILALAEESIDLCVLTEFSVAFPAALRAVADMMQLVTERLREGQADETVIADERQIEADLKDLLDALKQASRPSLANSAASDGMGRPQNLNKLLGELKMMRWMQKSLHTQTETADRWLGENRIDTDQRRRRTEPLADRQKEIRELTERIHLEYAEPLSN
jgi:hypothetical protein